VAHQPSVHQSCSGSRPILGIGRQKEEEEVLGPHVYLPELGADLQRDLATKISSQDLRDALSLEGQRGAQDKVQGHPNAEHVDLAIVLPVGLEDLRSDVTSRAATCRHGCFVRKERGDAKVGEDRSAAFRHEDVLRLHIAVDDPIVVDVGDGGQDARHDAGGDGLILRPIRRDQLLEVAAAAQLQSECPLDAAPKEGVRRPEDAQEADDVAMPLSGYDEGHLPHQRLVRLRSRLPSQLDRGRRPLP